MQQMKDLGEEARSDTWKTQLSELNEDWGLESGSSIHHPINHTSTLWIPRGGTCIYTTPPPNRSTAGNIFPKLHCQMISNRSTRDMSLQVNVDRQTTLTPCNPETFATSLKVLPAKASRPGIDSPAKDPIVRSNGANNPPTTVVLAKMSPNSGKEE